MRVQVNTSISAKKTNKKTVCCVEMVQRLRISYHIIGQIKTTSDHDMKIGWSNHIDLRCPSFFVLYIQSVTPPISFPLLNIDILKLEVRSSNMVVYHCVCGWTKDKIQGMGVYNFPWQKLDCVCREKPLTKFHYQLQLLAFAELSELRTIVRSKKNHKTWTKSPQIKDDAKHWVMGWGVIKEQKTQTKTEHLLQKKNPLKMSICTNVPQKPVLYISLFTASRLIHRCHKAYDSISHSASSFPAYGIQRFLLRNLTSFLTVLARWRPSRRCSWRR